MHHSKEELLEAKRQIDSTLHKLRETVKTLEGKENPARYKSQITLANRRIQAFTIAVSLIERELEHRQSNKPARTSSGRFFHIMIPVDPIPRGVSGPKPFPQSVS